MRSRERIYLSFAAFSFTVALTGAVLVRLPPDYLTALRVDRRRNWREMVDRTVSKFETSQDARLLDSTFHQAYTLMSSQKAREAFELHREPEAVREKYGMNRFGQSCLLARRLIEAGTRVVQVNWPKVANSDNHSWDVHTGLSTRMKNQSAPMLDTGLSALIEDLERARVKATRARARERLGLASLDDREELRVALAHVPQAARARLERVRAQATLDEPRWRRGGHRRCSRAPSGAAATCPA